MVKFKKSLGQNLLIDQNIINKISNLVDIKNQTNSDLDLLNLSMKFSFLLLFIKPN